MIAWEITHRVLAVATASGILGVVKISAESTNEVGRPLPTSLAGGRIEDIELVRLASDSEATAMDMISET